MGDNTAIEWSQATWRRPSGTAGRVSRPGVSTVTAGLAFFFVAVFGDGASAWSTNGPFKSFASCVRQADLYTNSYAFGTHLIEDRGAAISACYGKARR